MVSLVLQEALNILRGNRSEAGRTYGTNPLRGFITGAGEYSNAVCAHAGLFDCWKMNRVPASRNSESRIRKVIIVNESFRTSGFETKL